MLLVIDAVVVAVDKLAACIKTAVDNVETTVDAAVRPALNVTPEVKLDVAVAEAKQDAAIEIEVVNELAADATDEAEATN